MHLKADEYSENSLYPAFSRVSSRLERERKVIFGSGEQSSASVIVVVVVVDDVDVFVTVKLSDCHLSAAPLLFAFPFPDDARLNAEQIYKSSGRRTR